MSGPYCIISDSNWWWRLSSPHMLMCHKLYKCSGVCGILFALLGVLRWRCNCSTAAHTNLVCNSWFGLGLHRSPLDSSMTFWETTYLGVLFYLTLFYGISNSSLCLFLFLSATIILLFSALVFAFYTAFHCSSLWPFPPHLSHLKSPTCRKMTCLWLITCILSKSSASCTFLNPA